MSRLVDFQSFGEQLWRIADVFRDDTLKTTEYLEEFSYFFFLKLWDERERLENRILRDAGEDYVPYLPEEDRFYAWAVDPDRHARDSGYDSLVAFVQDLFSRLSRVGDVVEVVNESTDPSLAGCTHVVGRFWRLPSTQPSLTDGALQATDVARPVKRNLELFRKLFRNHSLRVRYDPTVRELCKRLLDIEIRGETDGKWDKLGRAYEYVVNKLGEQKQYGQYFTPRHIVDRIVKVSDPALGETIYDPAAGTCGFLVRAFEHVQGKIALELRDFAQREAAVRELKEQDLFGVEKAPDVYKLGLMNMILHGDGSTHLEEKDSLSNEAQQVNRGRYRVILTNPPFGPTAQERTASFNPDRPKTYELYFTQHILTSIAPGGRAAFVIKEGLLFDRTRGFRVICQRIVEQYQLLAVISLPNGVFNPYSAAKTSVLVIRRPVTRDEPRTEKVWFFDVESDGRDLGVTRRSLADFESDGDLAEMEKAFPYRFVDGVVLPKEVPESSRAWWVSIDRIRSSGYILAARQYAPATVIASTPDSPQLILNRLIELEESIEQDLQELLGLVSVPDSAAALEGAFRLQSLPSDIGADE